MGFTGAQAALQVRRLNAVRPVRTHERIDDVRHVAVEAVAAGRIDRMARVFGQAVAVVGVAVVAGLVGSHAGLEHVVGVATVGGVATEATHPAAAVLVAGGQGHAVELQGGGQRGAIAPEAAVGRLGFGRCGVRRPATGQEQLLGLGTEVVIVQRQVLPRDERIAMGAEVPHVHLGYQRPVAASADVVAPGNAQASGVNDIGVHTGGVGIAVHADMLDAGSVAGGTRDAQFGHFGLVRTNTPRPRNGILAGFGVVAIQAAFVPVGPSAACPEIVGVRCQEGAVGVDPALLADVVQHRQANVLPGGSAVQALLQPVRADQPIHLQLDEAGRRHPLPLPPGTG